jgi:FkbM family methyltransferase
MKFQDIIKCFITEILPESVQFAITRRHYLRLVANVTEASEKYFSIISHLVTSGDRVMDIGGNIGEYAKFLSGLVGQTGFVVSVEPLPRNIVILNYVKQKLRLDNVSIIRCAVSECDGQAELSIPRSESGVENYYRPSIGGSEGRKVLVKTRSIDSLLIGNEQRVTFIKIDVEGHELPCVRGAVSTLRNDRPALLVEVSGDPDDPVSSAANLIRTLGDLGYAPYAWDEHKVRLRIPNEHQGDYFFLTADHVSFLAARGLVLQSKTTVHQEQ